MHPTHGPSLLRHEVFAGLDFMGTCAPMFYPSDRQTYLPNTPTLKCDSFNVGFLGEIFPGSGGSHVLPAPLQVLPAGVLV